MCSSIVTVRYPQRAESTPTASQSEDTVSSMYSDEEDDDEIVASSDDDEQESTEDYCKGRKAGISIQI